MATKILVYDDNELIRSSLQALLEDEEDFQLIAMKPTPETVKEDVETLDVDVILMDIDMPIMTGVEAVKVIRTIDQNLPIIMLTVFDDNDNIFNAICAGASGYILKQYATEEIPGAIRMVMSGGAPMTGSVAKKVLSMMPMAKNEEQEKYNLTQKETAILQCLVNGFSYKMISYELNISIDTVRFHIKKIYDKLHVHSATEAVSKALKDRLV